MLQPMIAEMISEAFPNVSQVKEARRSVVNDTFQSIFSTIQETSRRMDENQKNAPARTAEPEDAVDSRDDTQEQDDQPAIVETDTSDTGDQNEVEPSETHAAVTHLRDTDAPADDEMNEEEIARELVKLLRKLIAASPGGSSDDLQGKIEKLAETLAERLGEISEEDLAAVDRFLKDHPAFSLRDILKAAGLSDEQLAGLARVADLNAEVFDETDKQALRELLNRLASLGAKLRQAAGGPVPNPGETAGNAEKNEFSEAMKQAGAGAKKAGAEAQTDIHQRRGANPDSPARPTDRPGALSPAHTASTDAQAPAVKLAPNTTASLNSINNTQKSQPAGPEGQKAKQPPRAAFERMIIDQIVRKVRINIRPNGASNMTIQLEPPSLGKVNVRIHVHDNLVRAVMVAESHEARAAIENNIDHLKNSLNNQGLKVDQITVTTPGGGFPGRNEELARGFDENRGRRGAPRLPGDTGEPAGPDDIAADIHARAMAHDGVLNIVV